MHYSTATKFYTKYSNTQKLNIIYICDICVDIPRGNLTACSVCRPEQDLGVEVSLQPQQVLGGELGEVQSRHGALGAVAWDRGWRWRLAAQSGVLQ